MTRYEYRKAVAMEWVKLRTLRSTTWVLGLGMALSIGLGVITGYNTRSATGDPTNNVLAGLLLAQVVMGVLGVLIMTGEYSSGTIRATLAAIPRRPLVLWAKALVFGLTGLAAGEIMTFASFLGGIAAMRSSVPHPSLADPVVLRAVVLGGVYLALIGLAGLGLGAVIRHSAAAAATLVGALFVLPLITAAAGRGAAKFMPELIAGNSLAVVKPVDGFGWSPWAELGIVAAYPVILLAAGRWLLVRRDA